MYRRKIRRVKGQGFSQKISGNDFYRKKFLSRFEQVVDFFARSVVNLLLLGDELNVKKVLEFNNLKVIKNERLTVGSPLRFDHLMSFLLVYGIARRVRNILDGMGLVDAKKVFDKIYPSVLDDPDYVLVYERLLDMVASGVPIYSSCFKFSGCGDFPPSIDCEFDSDCYLLVDDKAFYDVYMRLLEEMRDPSKLFFILGEKPKPTREKPGKNVGVSNSGFLLVLDPLSRYYYIASVVFEKMFGRVGHSFRFRDDGLYLHFGDYLEFYFNDIKSTADVDLFFDSLSHNGIAGRLSIEDLALSNVDFVFANFSISDLMLEKLRTASKLVIIEDPETVKTSVQKKAGKLITRLKEYVASKIDDDIDNIIREVDKDESYVFSYHHIDSSPGHFVLEIDMIDKWDNSVHGFVIPFEATFFMSLAEMIPTNNIEEWILENLSNDKKMMEIGDKIYEKIRNGLVEVLYYFLFT